MAHTFVEAHVDFPAIEADLVAIRPPTVTLDEILERLAPSIRAASQRGATNEQIRDSLRPHGIRVSVAAVARIAAGKEAAAAKKSRGAKAARAAPEPPEPAPPSGGAAQETLV